MPANWKTSAAGILTFLIATLTTLTAFQVPAALVPGSNKTWMLVTLGANLLLALCRVWLGLVQNDAPPVEPGKVNPTIKAGAWILLAFVFLGSVTGCSSWERTTFQSLATSKSVIDSIQADYEAGTTLPHSKAVYDALTAARAAQTAAVDAMVTYEQLKAVAGTPTAALVNQQQIVTTLLADIPPLIAAVKALYTSVKTVSYLNPGVIYQEAA